LDSILCAYTIEKKIEHSTGGLNTHTSPLYQRVFPCLDNMRSTGGNDGKMHASL